MQPVAKGLRAPRVVREYWDTSRAPRYSLLFALPLLLLYEGLAALLTSGQTNAVRNGADVLLRELFIAVSGRYAPIVFGVTVIGLSAWIVARDLRRHHAPLQGSVFATMFAESLTLALIFGTVVGTVTTHLIHPHLVVRLALHPAVAVHAFGRWGGTAHTRMGLIGNSPLATRVMLSLGAGLYEELLFRVILVSFFAAAFRVLFGWRVALAGAASALVAALIFSAFHYVGPYGDAFRLDSFVFRLLGGLAFSAVYLTRGFGITAWTHALYDLSVLLT
jgi:hypothetical protein